MFSKSFTRFALLIALLIAVGHTRPININDGISINITKDRTNIFHIDSIGTIQISPHNTNPMVYIDDMPISVSHQVMSGHVIGSNNSKVIKLLSTSTLI